MRGIEPAVIFIFFEATNCHDAKKKFLKWGASQFDNFIIRYRAPRSYTVSKPRQYVTILSSMCITSNCRSLRLCRKNDHPRNNSKIHDKLVIEKRGHHCTYSKWNILQLAAAALLTVPLAINTWLPVSLFKTKCPTSFIQQIMQDEQYTTWAGCEAHNICEFWSC